MLEESKQRAVIERYWKSLHERYVAQVDPAARARHIANKAKNTQSQRNNRVSTGAWAHI
jgi:hypothetical protein